MTWTQIKALLAKGDQLTEEQLKEIKAFEMPANNEATLQAEIDRLKAEAEAAANKDLPELDRLKKENERLTAKNSELEKSVATAKGETEALKSDIAIGKIATDYKFIDKDFLKYKLQGQKLDDEAGVKTFMENLKKDNPQHFIAEVNNGGAGSGGGEQNAGAGDPSVLDLLKKDNLTMAEATKVVEYQESIKQQQ